MTDFSKTLAPPISTLATSPAPKGPIMRRVHSIELHEQPWFPASLRDHLTGFLTYVSLRFQIYEAVVPVLTRVLEASGEDRVVDLCSGAGGPALWMQRRLTNHTLTLTDLYPNTLAWAHADATGHPAPVDVLDVPTELEGVRTMYAAFHHFRPEQATKILQDAIDKGQPFAFFEATERRPLVIAATLMSWLNLLLLSPFIRPRRWQGLLFTYLIPILPLVTVWDGVVSCLRTYTPEELEALCASLEGADGWSLEAGKAQLPGSPAGITYVCGIPPSSS